MRKELKRKSEAEVRRDAMRAARELFATDFFKTQSDCKDLYKFGHEVLKSLKAVKSPINTADEEMDRFEKLIGEVMRHANDAFPWNDPRLDRVPDVA